MRIENSLLNTSFLGNPVLQPPPLCWNSPLESAKLKNSELHLWQANLGADDWSVDIFYDFLSCDEKQRVKDFHLEHLQRRFIINRGLLRTILSLYLPMPAREIIFLYGPSRKPSVQVSSQHAIEFNLSHSNDMFLLGVNKTYFIGIDVESIHLPLNYIELARRVFNKQIYQELISLPTEKQYDYFFQQWTLKEAHLKALGLGLNYLHSDNHRLTPESEHPPLDIDWLNLNFIPKPGYIASAVLKLTNTTRETNLELQTFTAMNNFFNLTAQ
ncbi:hypothetical protein MNBD_GAMMA21-2717 [hydrothermal vent metagenome]|uniref:Uncharacterized protein n=1 Tax=hydrothermal vent metagenome TaxID=652676 RepID=A0A3B1A5C3_9ZZZZ